MRKRLRDGLINASILAGVSFFTALAGIAIADLTSNPLQSVVAAGVAAGLSFFVRLSVERGLAGPSRASES